MTCQTQSISTVFADDTKAYNKSDILQEDIKALQEWSKSGNYFSIALNANAYTLEKITHVLSIILKLIKEKNQYQNAQRKRI